MDDGVLANLYHRVLQLVVRVDGTDDRVVTNWHRDSFSFVERIDEGEILWIKMY